MKNSGYGVLLALVALPVAARDQIIKLSDADAGALRGKTVALTVHERPSFAAMTAGKMQFGLFGGLAMIKAGNTLIDENHVADPAMLVRDGLSSALRDAYGVQLLEVDKTATDEKKPQALAALHKDADYVLDVRSGGWGYIYFPTKWAKYWVNYSVQAQLIDAKTGRQVANEACNLNTKEHANPPSRDQLHADGAKLLKDVTASLGWSCLQLFAKDEFNVGPDKVAATPAALVDPLAGLASTDVPPAGADTAASANPPPSATAPVGSTETTPAADPASAPVSTDSGQHQ